MLLRLLYKFQKYRKSKISINNHTLNAIIADSWAKRALGLMFRKNLGEKECMLFVFPREGRYGIWMRNMLFPIDIIWINKEMVVVDYKKGAKPCALFNCITYIPRENAKFVAEMRSGTIKKLGIKIGSTIHFSRKE